VVLAKPSDLPEQTRALSTIQIFALNRAQLVKSRTSVLNELRYQAEVILQELEEDMLAGGDQRHVDRAMRRASELRRFQAGERPYTAMAKAFIDEFIDELAKRVHA
jgi:hypothetical protein